MEGEYPLNPNAVGILPYRKGSADPGILDGDNQTFVDLDSFGFTFNDLKVNLYGIPNLKIVQFALHLGGFNLLNLVHLSP
jgi:hypothetical protein